MQNAHTSARAARERLLGISVACVLGALTACGDDPAPAGAATNAFTGELPAEETTAPIPPVVVNDAGATSDVGAPPATKTDPKPPTPIDANAVLAMLANCNEVTTGRYKKDSSDSTGTIPICGLGDAVFWQADMDIDCDGKESTACNKTTDPWFMNETSGVDSKGDPLDSATLPFVVIPLKSSRFDYTQHGLKHGSVVMVIYKGKIEYGVFGDLGPSTIIGEASYAMAQRLGINPDPETGGTGSGVTYIAFGGTTGVVSKMEDHDEAVRIGETRARALLSSK